MRLSRARCGAAAFYAVLLFSFGIGHPQSKTATPSITVYKTPT